MTKDWDAVQDEIKELSFNQKKPLEEVKALMENKYRFHASTRAYRMKLKEWGLMRHKGRKARAGRPQVSRSGHEHINIEPRASSATAEPTSTEPESLEHRTKTGGWQVVSNSELASAEPTFMGLLNQNINLQPSIEIPVWMQDPPTASDALQDMLGCVLDNDCPKLESLLMEHVNELNDPLGMPFELPNQRFAGHPALNNMVIVQHPRQTLLDIASGMPNGPVVWVLLSYGAKGSIHPLGTDLSLHNAIKNGRHYTVQALLVPNRSDVNGLPDKQWKPLLQAVFWTGPEVVNILLKRGARVNDAGPSPTSPGMHTALQLCLERRTREYGDEGVRSKCNENLKLLLEAGASIHIPPPDGSSATPFEKFIEPWHNYDHWSMKLSRAEADCLGLFIQKGADLAVEFFASPCAAGSSNTFVHQSLWHSRPSIARQVVSSVSVSAPASGAAILHEVLGTCADAFRHPAETLKDVESLLKKGVDSNVLDSLGMTPLRKCIEQGLSTDVVPLVQKLLDCGADPEYEDVDGVQPYTTAALSLAEPARSEVMEAMLAKMQGTYTKTVDGTTYQWDAGLFPIPHEPTYQQVLSCTKSDDAFQLSMHEMVPIDVQPAFQRAYLAVISSRIFAMTMETLKTKTITERIRWRIVLVLSLRKAANLPNYQFDQGLVITLLDFPKINTAGLSSTPAKRSEEIEHTRKASPRTFIPSDSAISDAMPAYRPFQLNTNSPSDLGSPLLLSGPSRDSGGSNDEFVGDTTQIRWANPESTRAPGDNQTATYVLQFKCPVCVDDRLLTKTELQKHDVEHAHTAKCDGVDCGRRFCKDAKKGRERGNGCQDHLFQGSV